MASAGYSGSGRKSNSHIIEELEALSESLYQSHTSSTSNRRTASLVLPRSAVPPISPADADIETVRNEEKLNPKPRARRMSLSPWRSRPTPNVNVKDAQSERITKVSISSQKDRLKKFEDKPETSEKKGLWNWKPIRALSHITMQKLSCLFSVEVVAIQGLPASMNGLRLSVCARKKESKDGAVQTMPSRVSQGAADFEETLFIRTHVYYTPGNQTTRTKFEPRPFIIYVFAVDAQELDFGKSSVDLTELVQESIQNSLEGTRIRQWETNFSLSGKAKGGELILKLGIQIMEKDGGIGLYSQAEGQTTSKKVARHQSKASFSVPSPRMSSKADTWTPSQPEARPDLQGIDELNLDEPAPQISSSSSFRKSEEPQTRAEDLEFPDFEVVDKGVEIQDKDRVVEEQSEEEDSDMRSATSSEVVKEIVVHDQFHVTRLTELDSIAQQIKALESMMEEEKSSKIDEETESQRLDEDEETVTREFLQMLEDSDTSALKNTNHELPLINPERDEKSEGSESESKVYLPDLGKGLGCVVRTRNGGYLVAMNPLNTAVAKKDTPKLAMQISKPFILPSSKSTNGFELFQMMAALGPEELVAKVLALMPMDELIGKTAEQIAFEGVASALIQGRNKEGASSSAARIIAAVKSMANAMSSGRKERISTGIWNVSEDPLTVDEILAFSLQKIEAMAVEALKIQAGIAEEEAPFDVSPGRQSSHPLASAAPLEDWTKDQSTLNSDDEAGDLATITISVVIQLRDPMRQFEAVGGPMMALIHATHADSDKCDDENMFKVASLHVGGLKVPTGGRKNAWDTEKQRLTAMQWLVAYGLGKARKKGKLPASKGQDVLWSISSRIMVEMWLKAIRNPDIKFTK